MSNFLVQEHDGKASIEGRTITNMRFAEDSDTLAEEEHDKMMISLFPPNKESKEKKKHEICTNMTKHSKYNIYKLSLQGHSCFP